MSTQRYPEEFRIEAAKQILEHGHSVAAVPHRLGVSSHSLYKWVRQQQVPAAQRPQQLSQSEELNCPGFYGGSTTLSLYGAYVDFHSEVAH